MVGFRIQISMQQFGVRLLTAICLLTFGFWQSAQAQTATFAQFSQTSGGQDFVFTNNGSTISPNASFNTITGGTPVTFTFSNIAGLPAELSGPQAARVFVTSTTTQTAIFGFPNSLFQPFNQQIRITVIRDTPASVGRGSRTNLLTATISSGTFPAVLSGGSGGSAVNLNGSTPDNTVVFGSQFLTFTNTTSRNLALSFSSVNPTLSLNANGLLNSFATAGTGTFASNPVPLFSVATAADVSISGRVFNAAGSGLGNARVTLVAEDGATRTVSTNPFGYYGFADVSAGQTVLLSVSSKRYSFAPRTIAAVGETTDFDFVPE